MANGDEYGKHSRGQQGWILLEDQSAASNGEWCDISEVRVGSIDVEDLEAGGSIEIYLSNREDEPAADGGHLKLTIAAEGLSILSILPARWMRARKIAGGSPEATNVRFWGFR